MKDADRLVATVGNKKEIIGRADGDPVQSNARGCGTNAAGQIWRAGHRRKAAGGGDSET